MLDLAILQACGRAPGAGGFGVRPTEGAFGGANCPPAAPSLALPIQGPFLAKIEGLKRTPVTSVQELSNDVEAFFWHLRDNCPFFNDQEGRNSLQRIYGSLSEIFHGKYAVTDPEHIDYLSKALQYLRHSSFSNASMGFGILKDCPCPVAAQYATCFQTGESHATRAAAVVEHLVQQSRYFFQTLDRADYLRLHKAICQYCMDSGPINEAIQGSPNASLEARETAKVLLTVLKDPRMPGIKGPFTLYRGIGSNQWNEGGPQCVCAPFLHSTSTDPEVMRRFAAKGQWIIHIPAGMEAKAISMSQFVARPENEFVLGPCILEQTRQLSNGSHEEAPAYEYAYRGPVPNC